MNLGNTLITPRYGGELKHINNRNEEKIIWPRELDIREGVDKSIRHTRRGIKESERRNWKFEDKEVIYDTVRGVIEDQDGVRHYLEPNMRVFGYLRRLDEKEIIVETIPDYEKKDIEKVLPEKRGEVYFLGSYQSCANFLENLYMDVFR